MNLLFFLLSRLWYIWFVVYWDYRETMLKTKSEDNMLENFIKEADMPQEVIEKYKDQVPTELARGWSGNLFRWLFEGD